MIEQIKRRLRKYAHKPASNPVLAQQQAALSTDSYADSVHHFEELLRVRASSRDEMNNLVLSTYHKLRAKNPGKAAELRTLIAKWSDASNVPFMVAQSPNKHGRLANIASFRELMVLRSRQKVMLGRDFTPEWKINEKTVAHQFVEKQGVRRPESSLQASPVAELTFQRNVVFKPAKGDTGTGVFIVPSGGPILEVATRQEYASREQMLTRMENLLKSGAVKNDRWLVEELVGGDNHAQNLDIKFFCFHGEIPLVRIIQRFPEKVDLWMTPEGEVLDAGPSMNETQHAPKIELSAEQLKMVSDLSRAIPAPFMRIDFIMTSEGELVFGEFTPQPGSFAKFNYATDRMLGDCYLKAQARLMRFASAGFP